MESKQVMRNINIWTQNKDSQFREIDNFTFLGNERIVEIADYIVGSLNYKNKLNFQLWNDIQRCSVRVTFQVRKRKKQKKGGQGIGKPKSKIVSR